MTLPSRERPRRGEGRGVIPRLEPCAEAVRAEAVLSALLPHGDVELADGAALLGGRDVLASLGTPTCGTLQMSSLGGSIRIEGIPFEGETLAFLPPK